MSTIQVPGGIAVPITVEDSQSGYYRGMDAIGMVLSPFKMILNFIEFFTKLQDALEAVENIVSDPTSFVDKLQAVIQHITKLLQYIPQLSVPIMIRDSLILVDSLLGVLLDQISLVENILVKKRIAESVVEDFPDMEFLITDVDTQLTLALGDLQKMLEPLLSVTSIINDFGALIGFTLDIPTIDESEVSTIKEGVTEVRLWIQGVISTLGGAS